jgi:hypothetical protein
LLYGEEAITPEELKLGSFRTQIAATTPIQRYVELKAAESARVQAASNSRRLPPGNKDMERQEDVTTEHQPKGHGVDSTPRQVGKVAIAMVWTFRGRKHDQARSVHATQRRRDRNNSHLERR